MIVRTGRDIWKEEVRRADVIFITTNSTVKTDGSLVMGAGIAEQAARMFPSLATTFGERVSTIRQRSDAELILPFTVEARDIYGFDRCIGYFQTKTFWRTQSRLDLIRENAQHLARLAAQWDRVAMNFPGIGCGRLDEQEVWPLLSVLPDNVYVYRK